MKRATQILALLLAASLNAPARASEVEVLRDAGPPDKRFNIAVLGDGYRVEDQQLLRDNARAIVDYLFSVSPLRQYEQFFNVKLVHVISKDNGADHGSYGDYRDTALGAYFNCDNIDRLLCIDDGKAYLAAAADVPEYNFAIVLVNDPKYGGSGGQVCVSSSNEQSYEVLAHELGHSLAGLADEYAYEGNQPLCDPTRDCPEANATMRTVREQIKWKAWIDTATPLPTPASDAYAGVTGLFEGARYVQVGLYRPKLDCKMRDLGQPYCPVCSEQLVRSIWSADNVQMIESASPPLNHVVIDDCETLELSVTSPPVAPSTYEYGWSVDGTPLTITTNHAQLSPALLGVGDHEVLVAVQDATTLVRSDPFGLLHEQLIWQVSVTRECGITNGGSSGAGGGGGGAAGGPAGSAGVAGSGGEAGANEEGGSGGDHAFAGASGNGGSNAAGAGTMAGGGGEAAGGAANVSGSGGTALGGVAGTGGAASSGGSDPGTHPHDTTSCGCAVPGSPTRDSSSLLGVMVGALLLRRRAAFKPRAARS